MAVSYKHELITGARIDDAKDRGSQMDAPANFSPIPGLTPSFYLNPKDTYNFIKTFAGDERSTRAFDEEMGAFRRHLLVDAARLDAEALKSGGKDPHNFQRASGALGDLAGLE